MFGMRRRDFVALLGGGAAAWPLAARAQQPTKPPTIGYLGGGGPITQRAWVEAFVRRLRELGWMEGRTVAIEYRWGEGRPERYAEFAAEFVRLKVDVIFRQRHRAGGRSKTGDIGNSHHLPHRGRPGRQPSGRFPRATSGQCQWSVELGDRSRRQTARNPARGFSRSASIGRHGQYRLFGHGVREGKRLTRQRTRSGLRLSHCRSAARRISRLL